MMCKLICGLLIAVGAGAQITTVTGSLIYPDGSLFTGSVVAQLTRPTVANSCSHVQVAAYGRVTAMVSSGNLSISLYPSQCLSLGTGSTPLIVAGGGLGSGGVASATGTTNGIISLIAGTSPGPNAVLAYFTPHVTGIDPGSQCFFQASNANAIGAGVTVKSTSQRTAFTSTTAVTSGQTYTWNWICTIPYNVAMFNQQNKQIVSARWIVPLPGTAIIWGGITGTWASHTETWDALDANDITTVDVTQFP